MLTAKEQKIIEQMLSLVPTEEEPFTLKAFEGYLFGLAMTPDVILPSEWLPYILGTDGPVFESEKKAQEYMNCIMRIYNKAIDKFSNRQLTFPFDLDNPRDVKLNEIFDWAYGLFEALMLRDEIWDFDQQDNLTDHEKDDLNVHLTLIEALIYSELREELLSKETRKSMHETIEKETEHSISEDQAIDIVLLTQLPHAISELIKYAHRVDDERKAAMLQQYNHQTISQKKTGRNQPCPCGSGKKYKKCCARKDGHATPSNIINVDFSANKHRN